MEGALAVVRNLRSAFVKDWRDKIIFADGTGVQQDNAEALKWYGLAANQGNALGQNNLGRMYALGQGVSQDNVLAYMWFDLSAVQGFPEAIKNRDVAAKLMTPAQIAEAQNLVRQWKPTK